MKYIYGLSKSGQSIINYLNSINERFFCWDDNVKIRKSLKINKNYELVEPRNLNWNLITESFVSPGISFNNKKLDFLKNKNIKLYRDLEFYGRLANEKKIIAITGTNGKSTTTKLISDILNFNKIDNFVGGNLSPPLLDFVTSINEKNMHVIELSSFQLESFKSFKPTISILLNISSDHLERYDNFSDYIKQKEKIFNFKKSSFNIISVDTSETRKIFNKNKDKFIPISQNVLKKGIFLKNGFITDNYFENNKVIFLDSISASLYGAFNSENILAAYAVVKILKLNIENFIKVIKNFRGLPHRLERVFKNDYFEIINNSKATNLDSAIKSINEYKNVSLILGGKSKGKNFSEILKYKNNIKQIFLIGESQLNIFDQLNDNIKCHICNNLTSAVKKIFQNINKSKNYKTILFSPGCSSFDQFRNYEERGVLFKKLINKYLDE